MHILQLNFERGWRGGERQTLLSMQAFREQGHTVALLARAGSDLAQRAHAAQFTVYEIGSVPAALWFLLRQGRRFDVLHAQTANTLSWLAALKSWLGPRVVFTRRTAFPVPPKRQQRTLWKWHQADVFVAISQAAALEPQRLGIHTHVIPSALPERVLNRQRAQEVLAPYMAPGRHILGTVAALTPEKDPCTLIRAVHALKSERDDFVFIHLGAPGAAFDEASSLVSELGLQSHYHFVGFHNDVEDFYALMDVFVSSARFEALGTSVLDAFLYQVPVVSTQAGGLAESLANGRGVACPVGDWQALAKGMAHVLDNASLRQQMCAKARAYVLSEHQVSVMAQRYLTLYQGLVASR